MLYMAKLVYQPIWIASCTRSVILNIVIFHCYLPGILQQMRCRLSNMTIMKILFRGGNCCTYAHYNTNSSIFAHWSGVNQETWFAILRLFLLPLWQKYSGSIYSNHKVANELALLCV